jgi:hypothetical protein
MRDVYAEIMEGLTLEKAKKFPIGTVRTHGGVKKKKTAQGWVPVGPSKKKKAPAKKKKSPAKKKVAKLVQQLKVLTDGQKEAKMGANDATIVADYHRGDTAAVKRLHKRAQELLPGIRTQDSIDVVAVAAENGGKLPKGFVDQMVRENRVSGATKKKGSSLADKIRDFRNSLSPATENRHAQLERRHAIERSKFDEGTPEYDFNDSMKMYHEEYANVKNYARASKQAEAEGDEKSALAMLAEAGHHLREAKRMKKFAREEKKSMGKAQIQRLTMKKAITLYDAVQIAKAIGRVTGDASLETAGGKGASLDDAESFSIPKAEADEKKKKKKSKRKKKWKVHGSVPAAGRKHSRKSNAFAGD